MFWNQFTYLCEKHNVTPAFVAKELSLSNSVTTRWKKGSVPSGDTVKRIADYFNESTDFLLSDELEEPAPVTAPPSITLSPEEIQLIKAYRSHPEFHDTIRKLLDLPEEVKVQENLV